ncbi:hypothetical protein E3T55_20025 [Cryobacterium frigoriphilum]|uniref:Uncharacterized protein n=2 Tax=Cryobacterium frigoriphilum TaxID=1259150 RepID=A0A4V3IQD2_9MICO|nr:hypothetical protein E3T55_20025 [Cryobacterium frigoriphilum]
MNRAATYKAVLFGPNPIASGVEVELEYVDGEMQQIIVLESVADGETTIRTYKRGHHTEEPVPYRFVDEESESETAEGEVPN